MEKIRYRAFQNHHGQSLLVLRARPARASSGPSSGFQVSAGGSAGRTAGAGSPRIGPGWYKVAKAKSKPMQGASGQFRKDKQGAATQADHATRSC